MRECKFCNINKHLNSNFYKVRKELENRRYICKDCALKQKLAWKKTEKGKLNNRKWNNNNKRKQARHEGRYRLKEKIYKIKRERDLGFIPLNEKFDGSVAHHINNNEIIYIPEEIHKKCSYPNRDIHRQLVENELAKLGFKI